MKKLIAISVVFVLLASVAFAADVSGEVIGTVYLIQGDTGKDANGDSNPITGGAEMNRVRLEASGGDETFGGWFRVDGRHWSNVAQFSGYAWWKPIDMLKIWIGGNGGDGFFGKEGVTGWMFYQKASDTGVVNPGNVWGGGYSPWITRGAFYGGGIDGGEALYLTLTPMEMLAINLEIPYFAGGEVADIFKATVAQVDVNLDFGNIALTYAGDGSGDTNGDIYLYFGLGAIDNLGLDVGIGYTIGGDVAAPIRAGLGLKFDGGQFGVKFRAVGYFAGDDKNTGITADVLPYFVVSDSFRAFLSAGVGVTLPDGGDTVLGWHVNPYIEVGSEWGPCFRAGLKFWSPGKPAVGDAIINWAIPIAISVGF